MKSGAVDDVLSKICIFIFREELNDSDNKFYFNLPKTARGKYFFQF